MSLKSLQDVEDFVGVVNNVCMKNDCNGKIL